MVHGHEYANLIDKSCENSVESINSVWYDTFKSGENIFTSPIRIWIDILHPPDVYKFEMNESAETVSRIEDLLELVRRPQSQFEILDYDQIELVLGRVVHSSA